MNNSPKLSNSMLAFVRVQNVADLLPILRNRLPISGNILNIALMQPNFLDEVEFYTLGNTCNEETWILSVYKRENPNGRGVDIYISTPLQPIEVPIPDTVRNAFLNSDLWNWKERYCFGVVDKSLASLLEELGVMHNCSNGISCTMYYFPQDHVNIKEEPEVELRPLESLTGGDFINSTWKFSKFSSLEYIRKILERNPSSGLYLSAGSSPVSGMAMAGNGHMSMLYTQLEHRNKGYGKMTMQYLIQQVLKRNMIPCSLVEESNQISKSFHESIGMKAAQQVYFCFYDG